MQPRPKHRKILKWTGLIVSAALLIVWLSSGHFEIHRGGPTGLSYGLHSGTCWISHSDIDYSNAPGFDLSDVLPKQSYPWEWGFTFLYRDISMWILQIPLWAPPLITAAITTVIWRRDARMSKVGACKQCGYDLSGLSNNACPECGVKA